MFTISLQLAANARKLALDTGRAKMIDTLTMVVTDDLRNDLDRITRKNRRPMEASDSVDK